MRSSGNGTPTVCVGNLLKLTRGEVPYERVKGLNPRLIDRPFGIAEAEIQQDAEWLIETYEPRVEIRSINVDMSDALSGGFNVTADIIEKEE